MNRSILRLALAGLGLVGVLPAMAQEAKLAPSDVLRCLRPAAELRGVPEYPLAAFKSRRAGRVQVELVFPSPTSEPSVQVIGQEGDDSFLSAVERHVRDWRVTCLGQGDAPARLMFEFVFKREDGKVYRTQSSDANAAAQKLLIACIKLPTRRPEYPQTALRSGFQGRVLADLRFVAPDRPPEVTLYAPPIVLEAFGPTVRTFALGERMPCHAGAPVNVSKTFVFRIEDESYGFKPGITFVQLYALMNVADRRRMPQDTTAMACPFDVQLQYRQPDLPNEVDQVNSFDAARQPFLDWLRAIRFDVQGATLQSIYGDTVEFQVPCIKINPNPNPGVTQ